MSEIRIAARYAKSLIELAKEKGLLEQVNLDIRGMQAVLKQNPALINVLNSPIIKGDKKANIMNAVFSNFSKITTMFTDLVVKKRREMFLPLIADEFVKQYNQINGISSATVTTAVPLNEGMRASVKEFIEKQTKAKIDLKTVVDSSIIGGMIIRIEDNLYDSSIAKQLNQIRKELIHNN